MKVVIAAAGLGNMMFNYGLVVAYRHLGIKSILFVSEANAHHNGYELERVFPNVDPYRDVSWLGKYYYKFLGELRKVKVTRKKQFPHHLLFFPFKRVYTPEAFIYYPDLLGLPEVNQYVLGAFQCYQYYEHCRPELLEAYRFDENKLSAQSKQMAERIRRSQSVSIHVRRGDYMTPYFYDNLGSVCNEEYYKRAIEEIKKHVDSPSFFIFSDDKAYVKEHFDLPDATFVDFNSGTDSWQDMFLMSVCHHNIVANSSFSWWGAWLNQHADKVVIAPKRWWASYEKDDVVPPTWTRL